MKKTVIILGILVIGSLGYVWLTGSSSERVWNTMEKEMDTRDTEDAQNNVSLSDIEQKASTDNPQKSSPSAPNTQTPASQKGATGNQPEITSAINAIAELNISDTSDPFEGL